MVCSYYLGLGASLAKYINKENEKLTNNKGLKYFWE